MLNGVNGKGYGAWVQRPIPESIAGDLLSSPNLWLR